MSALRSALIALTLATPVIAQDTSSDAAPATEEQTALDNSDGTTPVPMPEPSLEQFLWLKRPVVVFADSENDLLFRRQMELLGEQLDWLEERDVVVLVDTDPAAASPLRKQLRPRGFQLVLIGKDGGVKLRKPRPWTVREISRVIDKMPMRQQELRQRWER